MLSLRPLAPAAQEARRVAYFVFHNVRGPRRRPWIQQSGAWWANRRAPARRPTLCPNPPPVRAGLQPCDGGSWEISRGLVGNGSSCPLLATALPSRMPTPPELPPRLVFACAAWATPAPGATACCWRWRWRAWMSLSGEAASSSCAQPPVACCIALHAVGPCSSQAMQQPAATTPLSPARHCHLPPQLLPRGGRPGAGQPRRLGV